MAEDSRVADVDREWLSVVDFDGCFHELYVSNRRIQEDFRDYFPVVAASH